MIASFCNWFECKSLGILSLGLERCVVEQLLGEPVRWEDSRVPYQISEIWHYGDFQLNFAGDVLTSIMWLPRGDESVKQISLEDVKDCSLIEINSLCIWLDANSIEYSRSRNAINQPLLISRSDVCARFTQEGQLIGVRSSLGREVFPWVEGPK